MKAYFLSDLHLKDMQERNSQTLLRFLHSVISERNAKVFLVGDIFDLWIGKHQYFVSRFQPIVDAVSDLVKAGVEVHYFEGNHDLYLKHFWKDLGVITHEDAMTTELQGLRVRIEHGDLMNPDDKGYLFLRWLLRTPVMKLIAYLLPSSLVSKIGERASHASRDYTSTSKSLPEADIRLITRTHAIKAAKTEAFDLIISGHVHVRDDYEFPVLRVSEVDSADEVVEGSVRSINLGSWFDEPKVFVLENSQGKFQSLNY